MVKVVFRLKTADESCMTVTVEAENLDSIAKSDGYFLVTKPKVGFVNSDHDVIIPETSVLYITCNDPQTFFDKFLFL